MKLPIVAVLLLAACPLWGQQLSDRTDSISYALGVDMGKNLSRLDMSLNAELIYQGMKDLMAEAGESKLTDQEVGSLLRQFQRDIQLAQQRKQEEAGKAAKEAGEKYLAENKTKEGIQVTESGLQYLVIQEGEGPKPTADKTVKVHYEGRLLNGEVFDSSYERGEPIEFQLNRVIPGWTEGVQLMSVGSKYRFFIPSDLGYGATGAPPRIGPNEVLIFLVELLEIKE